jgi:hypothetical protein
MKRMIALVLFSALFIETTGCEEKPIPTPASSINFVCRVSQAIPAVPGLYPKGTDGKLHPSTSSSKSAAIEEVRELYMADNPDAKRVQVACFSCDIVKDALGRAICDQ